MNGWGQDWGLLSISLLDGLKLAIEIISQVFWGDFDELHRSKA
jgi:hypothetical protein